MFQKLKGFNFDSFLDSKIAEEQAKQRGGPESSTRRTPSTARRASARTNSPSQRPASRLRSSDGDRGVSNKGPDPSEFVIEDDDLPSRSATPRPQPSKDSEDVEPQDSKSAQELGKSIENGNEEKVAAPEKAVESAASEELPQDIQLKLRKLQKLEARYHDLLRSYRVAHARVSAIEPFEASLRENTPLASINEPSALVEYLSQLNLKGDMVMEELKRVSGDRDVLKVKLQEAETKTKDAYDEAAGLRTERDDLLAKRDSIKDTEKDDKDDQESANVDKRHANDRTNDEEFFSYESEVPRLQEELREKAQEIERLTEDNACLRANLETAQSSKQSATEKLDMDADGHASELQSTIRERDQLRAEREKIEGSLQEVSDALDETHRNAELEVTAKDGPARERILALGRALQSAQDLDKVSKNRIDDLITRSEAAENALEDVGTKYKALETAGAVADEADKKRLETLDSLVKTLRSQLADAQEAKHAMETNIADLRKDLAHLTESQKLANQEAGNHETQEHAFTDLQERLERAERDRNDAYQVILDCGSCDISGLETNGGDVHSLATAKNGSKDVVSDSPAKEEQITAADTDAAATKKKSKSKSKKKKKGTNAVVSTDGNRDTVALGKSGEIIPQPEDATSPEMKRDESRIATIRDHISKKYSHATCDHTIGLLKDSVKSKESDILKLREEIDASSDAVDRLAARLKGEEELQEEIEGLKDDLMHIGNEHVGAKDQIKTLREQKNAVDQEHAEIIFTMKTRIDEQIDIRSKLEADIEALRRVSGSSSKELEGKIVVLVEEKQLLEGRVATLQKELSDQEIVTIARSRNDEARQKALSAAMDEMNSKAKSLQTDLTAANDLAQSRYRDLTTLREHLGKVQPELNELKAESAQLKKVNEELNEEQAKLRNLETLSDSLQSQIASHKSRIQETETEIRALTMKVKQNLDRATSSEEKESKAQKALARVESQQKETSDAKEKLTRELSKAHEELRTTLGSQQDLEREVNRFKSESGSLRDELGLKSAQQASAQSLMDSMQDQTRELATQMKEVRERCESLEEELADAHRLLSERSREGETMRRLLTDVEGRADARIKEMRDRMDLAVEERDRAEDDASAAGRRRAREVDELRLKLKDADKERSLAVEERKTFEKRESGFHTQRETLERKAAQAAEELNEVRTAMAQLREAIDEGERQTREIEKEKAELRRAVEDKERRLEKLQRNAKIMAEDLRTAQSAVKAPRPNAPSTRSSIDSSRVGSPARNGSVATTGGPDAQPATDYVYLKNVLLQFLEQKDKKHQMQLVPVLGMLLHFDKKDEQKWMTAITATK